MTSPTVVDNESFSNDRRWFDSNDGDNILKEIVEASFGVEAEPSGREPSILPGDVWLAVYPNNAFLSR